MTSVPADLSPQQRLFFLVWRFCLWKIVFLFSLWCVLDFTWIKKRYHSVIFIHPDHRLILCWRLQHAGDLSEEQGVVLIPRHSFTGFPWRVHRSLLTIRMFVHTWTGLSIKSLPVHPISSQFPTNWCNSATLRLKQSSERVFPRLETHLLT